MSTKRFTRGPKRAIGRAITILNANGSSGEFDLLTRSKNLTVIRMIMNGFVSTEAISGAVQNVHYEIWRKGVASGTTLPTLDTSGDLAYADDEDLLLVQKAVLMRETTGSNGSWVHAWDSKGQRKLTSAEKLVIRFAGGAAVIVGGPLNIFFKDV